MDNRLADSITRGVVSAAQEDAAAFAASWPGRCVPSGEVSSGWDYVAQGLPDGENASDYWPAYRDTFQKAVNRVLDQQQDV